MIASLKLSTGLWGLSPLRMCSGISGHLVTNLSLPCGENRKREGAKIVAQKIQDRQQKELTSCNSQSEAAGKISGPPLLRSLAKGEQESLSCLESKRNFRFHFSEHEKFTGSPRQKLYWNVVQYVTPGAGLMLAQVSGAICKHWGAADWS